MGAKDDDETEGGAVAADRGKEGMQCRRLLPSVARDHVRGVAARKVQREREEKRDAIFTLVQNTRRPNIRVLRGRLHCAKRDRALRRKIGHGRETEEGRLALGSFSP